MTDEEAAALKASLPAQPSRLRLAVNMFVLRAAVRCLGRGAHYTLHQTCQLPVDVAERLPKKKNFDPDDGRYWALNQNALVYPTNANGHPNVIDWPRIPNHFMAPANARARFIAWLFRHACGPKSVIRTSPTPEPALLRQKRIAAPNPERRAALYTHPTSFSSNRRGNLKAVS